MKIPGLSKQFAHAPVFVRVLLLVALLQAIASAQRGVPPPQPATPGGSYQLCSVNGYATGFFGEVSISGTFTMGTTPESATSNMFVSGIPGPVVNGTVVFYNYSFAGALNSPTWTQKSKIIPACVLGPIGCFPGSASLRVFNAFETTADLDFSDSGEDYGGTGTLSCKSVSNYVPNPQGPCPNVNVTHGATPAPIPDPPPSTPPCPQRSPAGLMLSSDCLPPAMHASATPVNQNGGYFGLVEGANACGYQSYNWQQVVTAYPASCPLYSANNPNTALLPAWQDPPPGGYFYPGEPPQNPNANPFFWDNSPAATGKYSLEQNQFTGPDPDWLSFLDIPGCDLLAPGTDMEFTTTLVGVFPDLSSVPIYTWTWKSTYNGFLNIGGVTVATANNQAPLQPGTGGATITSINGVQLPPDVPSNQVATTASGLAYSRVTQTFNGAVTITNTSDALISGPLQVVLFNLPAAVTLANATGNLSGTPYITVPATAGIGPGQSITVSVQFQNPSSATISLVPGIYSGSFQ